jgi:hypothetical protein
MRYGWRQAFFARRVQCGRNKATGVGARAMTAAAIGAYVEEGEEEARVPIDSVGASAPLGIEASAAREAEFGVVGRSELELLEWNVPPAREEWRQVGGGERVDRASGMAEGWARWSTHMYEMHMSMNS